MSFRLALLTLSLLLPAPLSAQEVSLGSERGLNTANVSFGYADLQSQIASKVQGSLLRDSCGMNANVLGLVLTPDEEAPNLNVKVSLDILNCTETPKLTCRGFKCKREMQVSRTRVYQDVINFSFALEPGFQDNGSDFQLSARPALSPADQKAIASKTPKYRKLEASLRRKVDAALRESAAEVNRKLPDAIKNSPTRGVLIPNIGNTSGTGSDGTFVIELNE